ncbi:unnamed protein product [Miscanthus lutarioriparius]|uniref:Myb/SANT-like domain-containing protein n=1 Tax=Miscanthus lutarioriparius TaxID=422564 RepID=A0A811QE50_9POAL|nr:unnamed protein product [Miscanthus lutarioriparius]
MGEPSPEREARREADRSGILEDDPIGSSTGSLSAVLARAGGGPPAGASWPGVGHGVPPAGGSWPGAAARPPPDGGCWPSAAASAPPAGVGWSGVGWPSSSSGAGWPGSSSGVPLVGVGWPSSSSGAPLSAGTSSAGDRLGWQQWNVTTTALFGPDWRETRTPERVEDDCVEIVGSGAPSRGGRGGRGGRSQKPPAVPAAPHRTLSIKPTQVHDGELSLDAMLCFVIMYSDHGPSEADWSDENTRIVCEIFADEVQKGNRANTHLNKAGYKNVIQRFKERTGCDYTRLQFKNKWDRLKGDYAIWKKLSNHQTGIGWDESKKNIRMPEAWWKKIIKEIKGSSRFKQKRAAECGAVGNYV